MDNHSYAAIREEVEHRLLKDIERGHLRNVSVIDSSAYSDPSAKARDYEIENERYALWRTNAIDAALATADVLHALYPAFLRSASVFLAAYHASRIEIEFRCQAHPIGSKDFEMTCSHGAQMVMALTRWGLLTPSASGLIGTVGP